MPSNHCILCRPLLLLPSIFPSIRVFSNESALFIKWPKCWSFSISPFNEYSGLISYRIYWFDLDAQETLKSLLQHHNSKASILWCPDFFMVQLSLLSSDFFQFSSVQLRSRVRLFATPWIAAHWASLSITTSQSSLKLMSIELVMPSNHLILSSPSPPTFNLSKHQSLFKWVSSLHQVAKVLEFQLQHQSLQWIFRTFLYDGLVGSPCVVATCSRKQTHSEGQCR